LNTLLGGDDVDDWIGEEMRLCPTIYPQRIHLDNLTITIKRGRRRRSGACRGNRGGNSLTSYDVEGFYISIDPANTTKRSV
jgi:hypothetical protein